MPDHGRGRCPQPPKPGATRAALASAGRPDLLELECDMLQRAHDLADGLGGDAGIERGRVELGMAERTRAIMLTFYVIESQSAVFSRPALRSNSRSDAPPPAPRSSGAPTRPLPADWQDRRCRIVGAHEQSHSVLERVPARAAAAPQTFQWSELRAP